MIRLEKVLEKTKCGERVGDGGRVTGLKDLPTLASDYSVLYGRQQRMRATRLSKIWGFSSCMWDNCFLRIRKSFPGSSMRQVGEQGECPEVSFF